MPKVLATLVVPTVFSSLLMVIYNLADTWFIGFPNAPILMFKKL